MPRIELSLAAWQAVAQELSGPHTAAAPPGLPERIMAQAPSGWPEQAFALKLDVSGATAVRAIHAALTHHWRSFRFVPRHRAQTRLRTRGLAISSRPTAIRKRPMKRMAMTMIGGSHHHHQPLMIAAL
jgi:hypothetical protein